MKGLLQSCELPAVIVAVMAETLVLHFDALRSIIRPTGETHMAKKTLLVLLAIASVTMAQDKTDSTGRTQILIFIRGQRLQQACKHHGEDSFPPGNSISDNLKIQADISFCEGFILGSAENIDMKWWSPPPNLTNSQVLGVVKKYIIDHPELWDQPASLLVNNSLIQAFPPKKQ